MSDSDSNNTSSSRTQGQPDKPARFKSSGLGVTKFQWELRYGLPNRRQVSFALANYQVDKYIVAFWPTDTDLLIMAIIRQVRDKLLKFEAAQAEAHEMLPADAHLVKTFNEPNLTGGPDNTVELYQSASLSQRYTVCKIWEFPWFEGGPGSIMVVYDHDLGSWSIGAGYSP